MRRVEGVVQNFGWGDPVFIPKLLGVEPNGKPWAEFWLGTHPSGPSRFDDGMPLADVTGELPYLLKLLAAAEPLSLQAHPTAEQAAAGYARGVFPDPGEKAELLCALTPFHALCGIRPVDVTLALLDELGVDELGQVLSADGPAAALHALYRGAIATEPVIAACATSSRPEAACVRSLDRLYPGEPSVAATLLLNLVVLEPGQALRLDPGSLHAYLRGAGIELMGASDNVVRGGLTSKPVDVDELLRIADPTPLEHPVLSATSRFELPSAGVALVRVDGGQEHVATGHELSIDLAGAAWYLAPGDRLVPEETTYVVTPIT